MKIHFSRTQARSRFANEPQAQPSRYIKIPSKSKPLRLNTTDLTKKWYFKIKRSLPIDDDKGASTNSLVNQNCHSKEDKDVPA